MLWREDGEREKQKATEAYREDGEIVGNAELTFPFLPTRLAAVFGYPLKTYLLDRPNLE